jgi:HSP20 family molecular chaperone IbpA
MKLIKVLLEVQQNENKFIELLIESKDGMHELEIYTIIQKMVPAYIEINFDDQTDQQGYSYKYKNGLLSISIMRCN